MNIYYNVGDRGRGDRRVQLDLHAARPTAAAASARSTRRRRASRRCGADRLHSYIVPIEVRIAFDHVVVGRPAPALRAPVATSPRTASSTRCSTRCWRRYQADLRDDHAGGEPADDRRSPTSCCRARRRGARPSASRHRRPATARGDTVTIVNPGAATLDVPLTVPAGTRSAALSLLGVEIPGGAYGEAYGGQRSALAGPGAKGNAGHAEAGRMRVALINEGTYPYVPGGVSTWCDQLVRGLTEVRWHLVSIMAGDDAATGARRCRPLWTPCSRCRSGARAARRAAGRAGRGPDVPGHARRHARPTSRCSPKGCANWRSRRSRRGRWFRVGRAGRRCRPRPAPAAGLPLAEILLDAWAGSPALPRLTLRDADDAAVLLEHAVRPLAAVLPAGGPVPRQRQRAGGAGRAGREVARRPAVPADRARRVPARAVPLDRRPGARREGGAAALPPGAGPARPTPRPT